MFEEDRFLPIYKNEYDLDYEQNILHLEKENCFINKRVKNENGNMKMTKMNVYVSGSMGSYIRDAITGRYYNCKVGSKEEDQFFKTRVCSGELFNRNNSNLLFFKNPHEFERYFNVTLDNKTMNNWNAKKTLI